MTSWVAPVSAQTTPAGGYEFRTLGMTGPGYEYTLFQGTTRRDTSIQQMNRSGQVIGYSLRYSTAGADRGNDAWIFDGNATQILGLTGDEYEYTPSGGAGGPTRRNSLAMQMNASGQAAGHSARYNAQGQSLGATAWVYSGGTLNVLGLTGNGYERTFTGPGGGTERDSRAIQINDAGVVLGSSERYPASSGRLGQDAWVHHGTTTNVIGLSGAGYDYQTVQGTYRYNAPQALNAAAHAIGYTERISNGFIIGQDAWLYNGVSSERIGLTGPGYEHAKNGGTYRFGAAQQLNASGRVIGFNERRSTLGNNLGQDAWLFNGSTSQLIGLTGSGYENASGAIDRYSSAKQINGSGKVIGFSDRRSATGADLGRDAWMFDGTSTQLIGLTGGDHESNTAAGIRRNISPTQINEAGLVAGVAQMFNGSGQDSWLYNGSTTRRIGLAGSPYEAPYTGAGGGVQRSSTVQQLNEVGQIIGYSNVYSPEGNVTGEDGWFYDLATDVTTALDFSFPSISNQSSFTRPILLTDEGAVLGAYTDFDASEPPARRVFWWSLEEGFHDLGSLVAGDLSAQQWQALADVYTHVPSAQETAPGGSPLYIVGTGQTINQSDGQTGFLLTAVPEPTLVAPIVAGLFFGVTRRRRR